MWKVSIQYNDNERTHSPHNISIKQQIDDVFYLRTLNDMCSQPDASVRQPETFMKLTYSPRSSGLTHEALVDSPPLSLPSTSMLAHELAGQLCILVKAHHTRHVNGKGRQ